MVGGHLTGKPFTDSAREGKLVFIFPCLYVFYSVFCLLLWIFVINFKPSYLLCYRIRNPYVTVKKYETLYDFCCRVIFLSPTPYSDFVGSGTVTEARLPGCLLCPECESRVIEKTRMADLRMCVRFGDIHQPNEDVLFPF